MNKEDLYYALICALTHNIKTCDECKRCGDSGPEARVNLIKELAKVFNLDPPWKKENEEC